MPLGDDFPSGSAELATPEQMQQLGREIGAAATAGDLIVLVGPLGAGKTVLARGIAAGLGVQGRVSSPTFVIAREHRPGARGVGLVHVDAYRLADSGEIDSLDLDVALEWAVVVAEWGDALARQLERPYLRVELDRDLALSAAAPAGTPSVDVADTVSVGVTDEPRAVAWRWIASQS